MAHDLKDLRTKLTAAEEWLQGEYAGIRASRAAPALLDAVHIEAYGTKMPLQQLAGISIEDARTLRITPYDRGQAKEIERALATSNLGVSVGADERGIRVFFPELTVERRAQLSRLVRGKLEEARVSVKKLRDEVWEDIQNRERNREIGKDEKFRTKEEMQKIIDECNKRLEEIALKKEQEILS